MSNTANSKRIDEIKGMNAFPLPKGPALALIRLTQREFVSLAVVAHAIKADPTFSVRAIKAANGVSDADHGPVVSLRDAVDALGVPAVRSLAMGFSLLEHYRGEECRSFDGARFWSQSLARAVALQLLAAAREGCPQSDAFSVGLLARVGELVLATLFPQPYGDLLQRRNGAPECVAAQEELDAFGATATALTASLLLDYNLPEIFVSAVESLDDTGSLDFGTGADDAVACSMLQLADYIGDICVAAPESWRGMMPELFRLGSRLSLDAVALIALCDRIAHEWREWGATLELETGPMPCFEESNSAPLQPDPAPAPPVAAASTTTTAQLAILLVGNAAQIRQPLSAALAASGHRLFEAESGRQGLAMAIEIQPQVMLVDAAATELDGIELIRTLRLFKAGRGIYSLLLVERPDDEVVIRALEAGADGFVALPIQPRLLAAHLQAGQRAAGLQVELRHDQEEVRRISAELSASNQKLQEAGMTDMLTGCPNRRYAMDRIHQEWAMAVRSERPLACMVMDIDNLKQVNDLHGSEAGDTALKLMASAFKGEMRAQDVLARSGGDEFLVICPDTSLEAALACAERMRAAAAAQPIVGGAYPAHGSVSIGVAVRDGTTPNPETLIRLADQSAYLAKRSRNAVATMQSGASPGSRSA